jgi:predicted dithiol-disulfide oxidoreductase (DUF899 family)
MNLPKIVSHDEWLVARKRLLAKEKDFTRARDRLNAERRRLPMVRIDKEYVFDGPDGKATLFGLFDGRRQLIVYHFMFDPAWDADGEGCSIVVDNIGHPITRSGARKRGPRRLGPPTPQSGPRRRADRLGNHRPRDPRTHR